MSDLKKKTLSGLFWTFSQQFGFQFINFFVSIILARLLLPEEFGLIGMIIVFIAFGNALVDSGMTSSLIRMKNPSQMDYSTVFFTNLFFSVIAFIVVYLLAPYISLFYDQDILTNLLRLYSVIFIIRSFSSVQATKLNIEMNFKKQLLINIPSLIIGSSLGIFLAYRNFGVWSLVWMNLVQYSVATIQLWVWSKWTPSLIYDKNCFKKHFSFGYKITLSGLLNSLIKNMNNIIIGKMFPPAQLGFFTRAKSMQELPVNNITSALNKVTYPMFASIANQDIRLRSIYRRLIQQVFFWVVPVLIISIIIAEPLFVVLLTDKWLASVPYFQILCLAGIVMPINTYNLNILLVKGKSDQYFKLEIVKNIIVLMGILLIIPYGIYGLLWGLVIATYITFFINAFYVGKIISITVFQQLKDISPTFFIGLLLGVCGFYVKKNMNSFSQNELVIILVISTMFLILYLSISYFLKLPATLEIKDILTKKNER